MDIRANSSMGDTCLGDAFQLFAAKKP